MKHINKYLTALLLIVYIGLTSCNTSSTELPDSKQVIAQTPPMGWNSFDAYDCRINETEFKATVDYMADNLLEYGWEYAVIDYIWWHPEPGNWDNPTRRLGHPNVRYNADGSPVHPEYFTMDEYGRLLPSVERFPSAANGQGFKPLADYVHSKGMKFGIHIMRGIPRLAAFDQLPIKNSEYFASDIALTWDSCLWNNHMWGVGFHKPGAQEYYNSLFELYASWGVDFVKADNMMFPHYHNDEIEMMHKAIAHSGRPMVLSLSNGPSPVGQAKHLADNSQMWRISADFWDKWSDLLRNFDLLNHWSEYAAPGQWPDADMIPFGRISLNDRPHGPERESYYTWPEHYTLMSLWCIAKSPLMIGSDLLSSTEKSLSFFKNDEVIYVNQHSIDNHQVYKKDNDVAWAAKDPANGDFFVAMFNISDETREVTFDLRLKYWLGKYQVRDLWEKQDKEIVEGKIVRTIEPHGAFLLRLSATK